MDDQSPLMLSVSGARGIVGSSMTPIVAARLAAAFGTELKSSTAKPSPLVVVGRDSRPSGAMFEAAAISGLASVGCRVIRLGIVMTPTVGLMINEHDADGGMVVTASHNPIQWNGLKCLNHDGVAPPPEQAGRVMDLFRSLTADDHQIATESETEFTSDDNAASTHVKRVLDAVDVELIRSASFKVVLDSINGAGCVAGRELLDALGVEVVHLNGEPNGQFAHTPEPTAENLVDLARVVPQHKAHVGFAQDPDADRLAIIDENGTYIGEEYTLVLVADRIFAREGQGCTAAANLSTSRMIDDVAATHGARVFRSPVGEANVVEAMKTHNCVIGGEGNGGVIWPQICWVRDSLTAMALVLETLATQKRSLSVVVDALPHYAIHKMKIAIQPGLAEVAIAAVESRYGTEQIDRQDGIRVDFPNDGKWVHVRPSNTEPILRVIAEAPTSDAAVTLANDVLDAIERAQQENAR